LGVIFEIARLWILNFSQYFKPNFQDQNGGVSQTNHDIIEVDELKTAK
jgi:hypothetical protein